MTNRITQKDLENLLTRINEHAGHGAKPAYGTPGAYVLSYAYGGVKLEQYCKGGGVRTISTNGYGTKRELYNFMQGMNAGAGM
jgi:hypothetical protein